jgi:hypothetical protein
MSQGMRSRELSPWVENFFSATLFGNRRPSTNHSWNGLDFGKLLNARSTTESEEREKRLYFISFFVLFAVNGLDSPRAVRIDLFRFFRERWIQVVFV